MKEQEITKLEFLMNINENIIVQRFFNVRDFNPKAKNSMNLYELINDFKRDLERQLRIKTVTYMLDHQYEINNDPTIMDTSKTDGPEHIRITIKMNENVLFVREIDAKVYPPKVRYTVDVRPHLKDLLLNLTDVFSSEELTVDYLDKVLVK
jgi:hypothetical protein